MKSFGSRLVVAAALSAIALQSHAENIVVVELFTSEGCSSCPPAEEIQSRVNSGAAVKAENPAITVAWHVDYWDRLGWTDPFASREFTERQTRVCRELGAPSMYTPQMVVNGTAEFAGADEKKLKGAVNKARQAPREYQVEVSATENSDNTLTVEWMTSSLTFQEEAPLAEVKPPWIDILVTEDGLASNVTSGENEGKLLHHDGVVRAVKSEDLDEDGAGSVSIELPKQFDPTKGHVVAVVRKAESVAVLGAAKTSIKSEAKKPVLQAK